MPPKKKPRRRVALAFSQQADAQMARVRRGILQYEREHAGFLFLCNLDSNLDTLDQLRDWNGAGAIVHLSTPEQAELARKVRFPLVMYGGALAETPFHRVRPDYFKEGEVAARHLMERGFAHFGYVGTVQRWYSRERLRGFQETLQAAREDCTTHLQARATNLKQHENAEDALRKWLTELPKPIALMVDHDLRSITLYEACHSLGLRIPSDVAVIGVDNDPLVTTSVTPHLTSVDVHFDKMGYEAMALLHRLMESDPAAPREIVLAPGEVVERASTEMVVVGDPALNKVIEHMRSHLSEPFGIQEVIDRTGASRRWLERAFRAEFGQAPAEFLARLRISRVKRLLLESPQMSVPELAKDAGFFSARQLKDAFRRKESRSLEEFRRGIGTW